MRRQIPTGSVYQKKYRDRHGKICKTATWHLKYYVHGQSKPIRVSAGTEDYHEAVAILRQQMQDAPSAPTQWLNGSTANLLDRTSSSQCTIGTVAELMVAVHLLNEGYAVFRALSHNAPCDLIAIHGTLLLRIEVKTTTRQIKGSPKLPSSDRARYDHLALVVRNHKIIFKPPLPAIAPADTVSCNEAGSLLEGEPAGGVQ